MVKIRSDLIISEQAEADKVYVIVKDLRRQKFFHMGGAAFFILQELQVETSLEEAQQRLAEKHGLSVPMPDLEEFVGNLQAKGLLDEATDEVIAVKTIEFDLLHLRVKLRLFDPDSLLTHLAQWFSFLFNRWFFFISATLIAFGVVVTFVNWSALIGRLSEFKNAWNFVLLVWGVQIVIIAVHELSHGVMCKFFGGTVGEMGIILIGLVLPGLYCNLGDIRLLDSKKERLIVLLAGIYSGFLVWSLGAIMWLLVPESSVLELICVSLVFNAALSSLANLNFILPLDGYYVLSEWTNIPNLRHRAVQYVIEAKLSGQPVKFQVNSKREKIIYWAYAGLSFASLLFLLILGIRMVILFIGNYL